jgi:ferredoxin
MLPSGFEPRPLGSQEDLMLTIVVDWNLCESNGVCMKQAPELFKLDENGELQILVEHPGEDLRGKLEDAIKRCPRGAISAIEQKAS